MLKIIRKNTTSLHDKVLGKIMDTRNISKHNIQCNIQQANIHYQTKWRETQNHSTKIRNKTKVSTLHINIVLKFLAREIRQ